MENEELTLDYVITKGKFKGKTIAEVIDIDRHEIFNMLKKGFYFDDDVLKAAHITRHIRDSKIIKPLRIPKYTQKILKKLVKSLIA